MTDEGTMFYMKISLNVENYHIRTKAKLNLQFSDFGEKGNLEKAYNSKLSK